MIGSTERKRIWCGRAVDHQSLGFMREQSLARIHAGETNGDVILEQTQSGPPPGCEPPGRLSVNAMGPPAPSLHRSPVEGKDQHPGSRVSPNYLTPTKVVLRKILRKPN